MTELTTQEISRAVWGCDARELCPHDARAFAEGYLYVDPAGPVVMHDLTGAEVKGWPVSNLDGRETVKVNDEGNLIRFDALPMVTARVGEFVSGREGAKLRVWMANNR